MPCAVCHQANREGVRYCTACGTPLFPLCPRCGFPMAAGDRWCGGCGIRLSEGTVVTGGGGAAVPVPPGAPATPRPPAVAAAAPPASERRNVTVVFADISGFTAMSEKLDPEEVTTLMNGCMRRLAEVVTQYEGYVDKFIGDCVMALFGAPVAHENDPELAIRACLEMMRVMEEYNRQLPIKLEKPLSLHIGINTGIVIAGDVGSDEKMQYTVMGDTVNLASRLESLATAGQILVSSYTYNLTRNLFEFEGREPIKVKGKQDPVSVHQVLGERKNGTRESGREQGVPLVGREREIRLISNCYQRFRENEGQVLFLVSDPGIGKSRVEEESRRLLAKQDIQVLGGVCRSFARTTSYHPFIEIFRTLFGVDSDDLADTVARKVAEGIPLVLNLDPAALPPEAREAVVFVATLMGGRVGEEWDVPVGEMAAQEIKAATFRAVAWLLARLAAQRPVLLVLEDLHFADTTSVELVAHLFRLVEGNPLLLLLLLRPVKDHPAVKLIPLAHRQLDRRCTEIVFNQLSSDECDQLARILFHTKSVPEEVLRLIRERSEGNPLFIEEIVRTLWEEGVVELLPDGALRVARELSQVSIPSGLYGIISTRIDHLSPAIKELLGVAAVIGPVFPLRLLQMVMKNGALDDNLEQLMAQEMILESQSFPEIEYSFRSVLIQETAYSMLLLQKRRALHLQVADAMEQLHAGNLEERSGLLAHHYLQAGESGRAYPHLVRAGLRAQNAYANEDARHYLTQALELGDQLPDPQPPLDQLYTHLAQVQELLGDLPGAIASHQAALQRLAEPAGRAECMRQVGRIQEKRGFKEEALAAYAEGFAFLGDQPGSLGVGRLLMNESWVLNRLRQSEQALAKGKEALAIFEAHDSPADMALVLNNLAVFHEHAGELDQALEYNRRSLELFTRVGDKRQIANVLLSLGYVHSSRHEFDAALEQFDRSHQMMERLGNRYGSATALLAKGRIYLDLERLEEAEQTLLQALRLHRELEVDKRIVANLVALAKVYLALGERGQARRQLAEARTLATDQGYDSDLARVAHMEATLSAGAGEDAEPLFQEAITLYRKLGRHREVAAVERDLTALRAKG